MSTRLSKEQRFLCLLLCQALTGDCPGELPGQPDQTDMKRVIQTAQRHKVLPLLYGVLCEEWRGQPLEEADRKYVESISRITVKQSYRLLFLTRFLVESLEEAGVPVLVLKGSGVAGLYPVPELRKSGDVDLLIPGDLLDAAREILEGKDFLVKEGQHANHHLAFRSGDGIDLELHTMLAEPFRDAGINRGMDRLLPMYFEKKGYGDCMGVRLPVPQGPCQALQLLLHMLQHFQRAGFGLKQLCDWVVFWNREEAGGGPGISPVGGGLPCQAVCGHGDHGMQGVSGPQGGSAHGPQPGQKTGGGVPAGCVCGGRVRESGQGPHGHSRREQPVGLCKGVPLSDEAEPSQSVILCDFVAGPVGGHAGGVPSQQPEIEPRKDKGYPAQRREPQQAAAADRTGGEII